MPKREANGDWNKDIEPTVKDELIPASRESSEK
jgi:hypothetical protein